MSFVMNIHYTGRDGSAQAYVEEMRSSGLVSEIRSREGNLRYDYYQSLEDPETVLLIDEWADQATLDAHHASPAMQQIVDLREKHGLTMRFERFDPVAAE